MPTNLSCFKAYDIRGKVPTELNADIAYRLGRAYAVELKPAGPVCVGRDIRLSSPELAAALCRGLNEAGAPTRDLGPCITEMVYFAAARPGIGGGIMITASHNPKEYNGMKLVRAGAVPISGDSGLHHLERRVRENNLGPAVATPAAHTHEEVLDAYIQKILTFVNLRHLRPLTLVTNSGNGCAGPILDALAAHLPFQFVRINHEPDGAFPHGVPNPMLTETHAPTIAAMKQHRADLGIAWDGDGDRCFFFDETGAFVDGYYIVGLLAKRILQENPGAKIIHDPRLFWNTLAMIAAAGGIPVQCKTGHAFIKECMRKEDAVYGGEVSAHHYFRNFAYCDSGMIPWLLVTELLAETGLPLSALIGECARQFPTSGEINSTVSNAPATIHRVRQFYAGQPTCIDETDGVSLDFAGRWRFNLRSSQTEPILRLNVETRGDPNLLRTKTAELLSLIRQE